MMTPDEQLEDMCQVPYTSCEENGHVFVVSEVNPNLHTCTECGESYTENE